MNKIENKDISLGSLILPSEVFAHFELVEIIDGEKEINLFLDEKFVSPSAKDYTSKGFTEQSVIQDFPSRCEVRLYSCIFAVASGKTNYQARLLPTSMT